MNRDNRIPVAIGIAGIVLELAAIVLLAMKRLPTAYAQPVIFIGMFMAFVPIFVIARRARRR